jgi:adenylate cyclase
MNPSVKSPMIDPVCGTEVDDRAPHVDFEGKTYHFCSKLCRERFQRNPGFYLDQSVPQNGSLSVLRWDLFYSFAVTLLTNTIAVVGLMGYFWLVYGWEIIYLSLRATSFGFLIATVGSLLFGWYFLSDFLKLLFDETVEEITDSHRRDALNAPIIYSSIALFMWLIPGSFITILYQSEIPGNLTWFMHVFVGNYFAGQIVAIFVFYVTESIYSRRIIPFLMRKRKVSTIDGVIPVPIWVRITFLILTTAILPMTHLILTFNLLDPDLSGISYAMGAVVLIGFVQGVYIIRSISLPIGQIADKFQRFQENGTLERSTDIYRADALGRFSEMFNDHVQTIHEKDFLRATFGRYMSREVMDRILEGDVELGGEKRDATVVFTDFRNFTSFAEEHDPEVIVELLNSYFDRMVQVIVDYRGIPDKFIGDGLLAVWGIPGELDNHRSEAVRATLEMLDSLKKLNEERRREGKPVLDLGAGIHSGELIAGNIGSSEKMEFTVIGDTVNTCSRIEGRNKQFDSSLILSEHVYKELSDSLQNRFKMVEDVDLRGKRGTMDLYVLSPSESF